MRPFRFVSFILSLTDSLRSLQAGWFTLSFTGWWLPRALPEGWLPRFTEGLTTVRSSLQARSIVLLTALITSGITATVSAEETKTQSIEIRNTFGTSQSRSEDKSFQKGRVIKDQKEWNDFCQKAEIKNIAPIDFEKEMVLVISAERYGTTGYEIKIHEVTIVDKKVMVKYTVAEPIPGETTTPTATAPLSGVIIEKRAEPVEFSRAEANIESLTRDLGDDDWEKRQSATETLIKMGKPVVKRMVQAFKDKDPEVRMRARLVLENVVPNILTGHVGWIGISWKEIPTSDARVSAHINEGIGIELLEVVADQPSEKFGLKEGDIIITANGEGIANQDSFVQWIRSTPPGSRVRFGLVRGGQKVELDLVIGSRPKDHNDSAAEQLWKEWSEKYLVP